jgi:hypothetical protein
MNMKVSGMHVNMVKRWQLQDRAGAKQAGVGLHQYYYQIQELRPSVDAYYQSM